MNRKFPLFTLGFILTFFLAALSMFASEITDSTLSGKFIFPLTYGISLLGLNIGFAFLLMGFLQFPVYGLVLDSFNSRKSKIRMAILLFFFHFMLVALLLQYQMPVQFKI